MSLAHSFTDLNYEALFDVQPPSNLYLNEISWSNLQKIILGKIITKNELFPNVFKAVENGDRGT